MKKIIAIGILSFIICSALEVDTSIKVKNIKQQSVLSDYRDVYTGVYACKRFVEKLSSQTMQYNLDTSRVNITISKDNIDSVLQIGLGEEVIKAKLIGNSLQPYPFSRKYGGKFFSTDKFDFFYTPNKTISLRYKGKKN